MPGTAPHFQSAKLDTTLLLSSVRPDTALDFQSPWHSPCSLIGDAWYSPWFSVSEAWHNPCSLIGEAWHSPSFSVRLAQPLFFHRWCSAQPSTFSPPNDGVPRTQKLRFSFRLGSRTIKGYLFQARCRSKHSLVCFAYCQGSLWLWLSLCIKLTGLVDALFQISKAMKIPGVWL